MKAKAAWQMLRTSRGFGPGAEGVMRLGVENQLTNAKKSGAVTRDQAVRARAVLALTLMRGGTTRWQDLPAGGRGAPVSSGTGQFWTDYAAGSKDRAQEQARELIASGTPSGTVEMTAGGSWLDKRLPWAQLSAEAVAGQSGAKYVWDVASAKFAGAARAAEFTAPRGLEPSPTKNWQAIEEPILRARYVVPVERRF
jgi:hypothetical protein